MQLYGHPDAFHVPDTENGGWLNLLPEELTEDWITWLLLQAEGLDQPHHNGTMGDGHHRATSKKSRPGRRGGK